MVAIIPFLFVAAAATVKISLAFSPVTKSTLELAQLTTNARIPHAAEPTRGHGCLVTELRESSLESGKSNQLKAKVTPVATPDIEEGLSKETKKYVVVGGGWGGWGAAKALCESEINVDVTLIDALPDPTGVSFLFYFSGICA